MSLAARVLFRTVRSVSQVWGATAVEHVDNAAASATGWVASTMARSLRGVGYGARGLTEHGAFDAGNDDSLSVEEQAALDHFIDSVEAHAIASVFSVIAIALSCHLMYKHLQHYARPLLQRQIIRIVMIVPVYAFCSALSLGFDHYAPYINALRDVYEALCIHCFLALMLDFPGGEDAVIEGIREKPKMKHPKPFCWCPRIRLGVDFIVNMKRTTLQFVFLKPLMALISIAAMAADVFDTPELQTFLLIVYNVSYTTALYGLLLYYVATKQLMKGFSPVGKFGAVKIIVFATYYQSLAVVAIPGMDALGSSEKWNDFIICFEMALFAVMHEYAFGYQEFLPGGVGVRDLKAMGYEEPTNIKIETDWRAALSRIPDVANISDVIADMRRNFSWSAGTYILQGVDGGIMNEGTVEMEEQRKAGTQASRIKAMLQGKRNQLKEEKGDEEEGKEGESGAAKAAAAAAAGTGMNGVANGSGADDGGDDGPTSPGSLAAAAGGDFASELAAMQISESADVKAKEAREKAEKDRIEREQRMKEGEASKAAAIIAGVKDGGIVSGREAAASTAALMAASAAAAQQLLAKMKKEQDAASGGPAAARARRAAANQAAGSAAVEASVPSGQHQGSSSSGTGNGPELRFAGDEDDNDGSGQAKALDELKKANPAFAGSIVATGLGGSKAGKVTGAAVAALGGAAVAVATTVTARVTESAARHGLGPRPKEAASDRITAANVLAPVVDGAPDAAEVERLVKDASIKAAKEKAERAAAAAAAAAAGGTSASGAGAAPAAQQPAAARLKIDASRVKVGAPASAGAAGASAKAASATPAAAAGWDGGFDEKPQAKPAATPASASSASATSGEWNPDAEFGAEAAAAPATAAVAAWDPDAAFADHAASAAPASAAAASSSSKSATPKSPPPAAGSAAKPAASAYASAASSAAGSGDAWDASDVSFDIPLAAVAATAASAVNAPGAGAGAPSSTSSSGRARAPSGATTADDGVEAEAGGAAAAEEAQEAAAEQQERPIEDDGQESVHADDNNNGADDGAEQDEAGGEVVNAAPVPAAEQPAAAAEGFATLEEDSGDSDEQPEATAGSASPSTGHGRVPPQPPSGAASPVHVAADSDANGDAAPVDHEDVSSAEVEFPTAAAATAASGTASSHEEWGLSFDSDATAAFGNAAAADAPGAGAAAVHVVDPFGDEVSFDLK